MSAIPKILACALLPAALQACAFQATTMSAPNLNIYSNYAVKVPGKWLISIDASQANQDVHVEGMTCAAHHYPLDFSSSFKQSVLGTFQNLADEVELVDTPPPASTLGAQGTTGVIHISLDQVNTRLEFIAGFWSSKARSDVELTGGMIVDGPNGRLLGTQASGHGGSDGSEEVTGCGDGAIVLGHASEAAMKSLMGSLGERFSNAPQLRQGKATSR